MAVRDTPRKIMRCEDVVVRLLPIVRRLAALPEPLTLEHDPIPDADLPPWFECVLCRAVDPATVLHHAFDCPWRLAMECTR